MPDEARTGVKLMVRHFFYSAWGMSSVALTA